MLDQLSGSMKDSRTDSESNVYVSRLFIELENFKERINGKISPDDFHCVTRILILSLKPPEICIFLIYNPDLIFQLFQLAVSA